MSRIKGRDTWPEKKVRSILHKMGYRYQLHRKDLPGKPDITLVKYKTVIFIHGCFWHRHQGCKYCYTPKSNKEFWLDKFNKNIERDKKNTHALEQMGWQVLIIWECETRNDDNLIKKFRQELS